MADTQEYPWEDLAIADVPVDTELEIEEIQPTEPALLKPEKLFADQEVEKTLTERKARREACRCLRCDYKG